MPPDTFKQEIEAVQSLVKQAREGGRRNGLSPSLKARILALSDAGVNLNSLAKKISVSPSAMYSWRQRRKKKVKPHVFNVADSATYQGNHGKTANQNIEIRIGGLILIISQAGG